MATQTVLDQAIDSALDSWAAPAPVFRENEPSKTKNLHEYIIVTNLGGASDLSTTTGLLDQRGSTERHAFLLRFSIYTKVNTGTSRASSIVDAVAQDWRYRQLALGVQTFQSQISTVGKQVSHYLTIVDISGLRDETL